MWTLRDPRSPLPDVVGDRAVLDAVDVAEVDRQVEEGMAESARRAGRTARTCR